jgi:hypothetical protein
MSTRVDGGAVSDHSVDQSPRNRRAISRALTRRRL